MKLALLALAAAAALAGCGSSEAQDPTTPIDGSLISFSRSGGIAFTVQELEVLPDGSAELTNLERGKPQTVSFQLSEAELDSLTAAVEAVDPSEVDVDTQSICADCYTYAFTFPDGTEIEFDQSIETPPELEPLLGEVTGIVEANSPPNQTGS